MNRFRKLTSFLLALALILSLLGGMGPVAAEAKGNDRFDFTAVVVNPLYQDVISEEDIPLPQKSSSWGGVAAIAEPDYLDGEEEAALAIREAMVSRETEPVIYFSSTFAVSTQEEFQAMLEDLFSKAYAHTGVPNEGDYLRWHYGGYSASISGGYGEDNTTIYYELSLELVYYTTAAQEAEVDAKIHQLMDSWDVDNEHDYIILKTIYDYICANVVYDHAHVNDQSYKMQFTAYAALIDDVAVCQGYANLFYRMALEYGIDARLIAGDGGGPHGWNIAQLNGLYYNLDSTWDAGYTDYGYFLVCPNNFTDHIRYEEYDTAAFHAAYPMDDEDFDPGSMGCSHTYGKPVDTATCTQAGTKTYTCTQCGETKTETSPALGHSGGTASCTQLAVCTVCGEAYGELTDHEYADEWASDADNHWLPCQNCENKSNIAAHTPNVEAATEETEQYCTICGYVMEAQLSHSHSTTQVAAVAATCTEAGSRAYYTCNCGKWFEDAQATKEITDKTSIVIDALGHDTELQNQKDATATEPGYTGDLVCKRCEKVIEEGEEIPATGTSDDIIASGECGEDLTWTLDKDGLLTISGSGEMEDYLYEEDIPWYKYHDSITNITLEASVTSIGNMCFHECINLSNISIPNSVTSIGDDAFSFCSSLASIIIPSSVTSIGHYSFEGCTDLTDVTLPDSLISFGEYCFSGCESLSNILIPQNIVTLSAGCFNGCKNLDVIDIPANVKNINAYCFYNCPSLSEITFSGDAPFIESTAFNSVVASAYYPAKNATWTEDVMQDYGGTITWIPYSTATVQRIAGETRYETGINSANALKEIYGVEKFNTIILACGGFGGENDNGFADALTGSYLAYVTKAPILMHSSEPSVEASIEANLAYIQENLASDGIVYILGGSVSVPEEFENALKEAGIQVERLYGADRFVTNLEILNKTMELEQAMEEESVNEKEILISSGWGYADSLSIGATGLPILLLKGNNAVLTDAQKEFLNTYKDDYKITIVGGSGAVSEEVEAAVEEIVGKDVGRIYGAAREETSVAVAKAYFNEPEFAVVAYSYKFYDGLCGGPVARAMNAPLLLTNTNKTPMATTSAYLEEMGITAGYVMGVVDLLNDNAVKTLFGLPSDTVIPSV